MHGHVMETSTPLMQLSQNAAGTFASEKEEVVYGLIHPLRSWDAVYTQVGRTHIRSIMTFVAKDPRRTLSVQSM